MAISSLTNNDFRAGLWETVRKLIGELQDGASNASVVANQADSAASDVAAVVADFNALLDKLKAAGIMEAD